MTSFCFKSVCLKFLKYVCSHKTIKNIAMFKISMVMTFLNEREIERELERERERES